MRLQDGDSEFGRFMSPSGREIKSYSSGYPLPPEKEVEVRFIGSLRLVVEVLANFSEEKREILRSINFDGVLEMARFETFDLYFYLWLMTKIDSSRCSITTSGSEELPIRDSDVNHIIGIPWSGIEMVVEATVSHDTMTKIREILCVGEDKPNISMGHITHILTKTYGSVMSNSEVDAFKVAAVLFIFTNLLATGGPPKDIPLGILKFLIDPSKIHMYNWALLVRRYLVSWSHFINQQLKLELSSITIGGCFIVPLALYLDNIAMGAVRDLDYKVPRAKSYSSEIMQIMIASDTINSANPTSGRAFGKSKLKTVRELFYGRWIVQTLVKPASSGSKRKLAGELPPFVGTAKKTEKGMAAKLVFLSANKGMRKEIMPSTGSVVAKVAHPNDKANEINKSKLREIMKSYIKAAKYDDKNNWDKFYEFYDDLKNGIVQQLDKCWVHHLYPFEIKIKGSSLAEQLIDGCPYYSSVCDAILRNQVQHEDSLFSAYNKRPRHLMPASFIDSYREMDKKSNLEKLRTYFVGGHLKYKVSECYQINMPISIRRKWSCYSWNLVEKKISVLDPILMGGPPSVIEKTHSEVVSEIHSALFSCLQYFYPEWANKASDWTVIYRNDISTKCNWSNTGLYSIHYAVTFDNDDLTDEINSEDDFIARKRCLWGILSMEGNVGDKPDRFEDIERAW